LKQLIDDNPCREPLLCIILTALALLASLVSAAASTPDRATPESYYNLLADPGLEQYDPPYGQWQGVDCQVASGWQRFWSDAPEPCWMDARVFAGSPLGSGWVEHIEGETAQFIVATEPYTSGILQRVTGLTPGVGYGFHAVLMTIFQTSAPPSVDGMMFKQVGMDPSGGTDPLAPTVVWSEPWDADEAWDLQRRTAVVADSQAMTVFVRVLSPYSAGDLPFLNLSILDSSILAQTPVITATSPPLSLVSSFPVNWNHAVLAPGGGQIKWRDVQWLDEADGVWHDWITHTYDVEAPFLGQWGRTYRFRARVWQRYPNNAWLHGPYRPAGDTRTTVAGGKLTGQVLRPDGQPVGQATVAISGTTYAATSGLGGRYELSTEALTGPQTVTIRHLWWASPPPVFGATLGPTRTVTMTWTLRPPDDAVSNGGFEQGLDGWSLLAGFGDPPAVVTVPVHTGFGALALGGPTPAGHTVGVSQTLVLTDAWEPVLSFWYRPAITDSGDVFNVLLTTVTQTIGSALPVTTTQALTPALQAGGWRHAWAYVGRLDAALTGTVTLQFLLRHKGSLASPFHSGGGAIALYLDEISIGAMPGGPHRIYLPLSLRQH